MAVSEQDVSMDELLDAMEQEERRRREMLRLPFECRFGDVERVLPQLPRSQSAQLRINVNRASHPSLHGPASLHPSDPTLQLADEQEIDEQVENVRRQFVSNSRNDLHEQRRNETDKRRGQDRIIEVYRDGIPPDFQALGYPPPISVEGTYRKPPTHISKVHKQSTYFHDQQQEESLDQVCRRLRKMRHKCEEADRHALKCKDELKNYKIRNRDDDRAWWRPGRDDWKSREVYLERDGLTLERDEVYLERDGFEFMRDRAYLDQNGFNSKPKSLHSVPKNSRPSPTQHLYPQTHSNGLYLDFKNSQSKSTHLDPSPTKFQSRSGDHLKSSSSKTITLHRRSDSFPPSIVASIPPVNQSLQRLEAAGRRFPQLEKALGPVLGMRGDKNLVFEFMEMLDRRVRICEDQMKRMLRDRCNIPKTRRHLADYEICSQQKDVTLLHQLATNLRSHLKIAPTDDYIQRQIAANKRAPDKRQQLAIVERSIGEVYL